MTNILKKLGIGIVDFGKWFAGAVQDTVNLSVKIEKILKAAKPLEAPFAAGLAIIVADVEALIAASSAAVTANGLNFPADTRAYQQFLTLIADFKKMAPIATQAIQILEGKTAPAAPPQPNSTDENKHHRQPGAENPGTPIRRPGR